MDETPTAAADPKNPEQVGPYLLERQIGSGGMGTVHLARHEETGQEVALKVLPPSLSREEGFVARFQREITALEKLKNPYVVELYDSGVDGDLYYYAMEYVDGITLAERIRKEGRIDWRETIAIAVQVCKALKAAHDAGVIHRDLKPSNLMLKADGTVKLTDFGVAQVFAASRLTKTGGVIGTVEYMSPEQAKGGRVTKRSDLYSLGALIYAMLTARPPFAGKTSLEIIQKHQFGRFDRPRMYVPEIPIWLDDLVCQLLEKNPDDRPPDAYVLSRRLQEIVNKVELSLQEVTVAATDKTRTAMPKTMLADGSDAAIPREPGVGTLMRDVMRDELASQATPGMLGRLLDNTWVLVGLLVLLIAGGIWWWNSRALTPDEKFAAGEAIMQQAPSSEWFEARDKYFLPLVEDDPGTWKAKVEPYLYRIRLYDLEKQFIAGRPPGRADQPQNEAETFLFQAVQLRSLGENERAERKLDALKTLIAGQSEQLALYKTVLRCLSELRTELAEQRTSSTLLPDAMVRIQKHIKEGEPTEAAKLCRTVIELYGDNPAARSEVARARKILRGIENPIPKQEKR